MNLTEERKQELIKLPTGNIADNNNDAPNQGVMDTAIKPVDSKMKMIGRAFTAQCYPGDNLALHQAIYAAKPGDIVFGDCDGVVVIPQEHEDVVFEKALAKFEHEQEIVAQLNAGKTTLEIYGFDKLIESKQH